MSDDVKTKEQEPLAKAAPATRPVVGRQFPGQQHYAVTLPEEEAARVELQKQYDDPNAVPLNVYFSVKQIRNPVMQASMRAYTKVERATVDAWDEIFRDH